MDKPGRQVTAKFGVYQTGPQNANCERRACVGLEGGEMATEWMPGLEVGLQTVIKKAGPSTVQRVNCPLSSFLGRWVFQWRSRMSFEQLPPMIRRLQMCCRVSAMHLTSYHILSAGDPFWIETSGICCGEGPHMAQRHQGNPQEGCKQDNTQTPFLGPPTLAISQFLTMSLL